MTENETREVILQGMVTDLNILPPAAGLGKEEELYIIVQSNPEQVVERGTCLLFGYYREIGDIGRWQEGRIFCRHYEWRWHKYSNGCQVVYTGDQALTLPGLQPAGIDLAQCESREYLYHLRGRPLDHPEQLTIKPEPGRTLYYEARLPEYQSYPVPDDWKEAAIGVREYYDPIDGRLVYHRYLGLSDPSDQPGGSGGEGQ